MSTDTSEKMQVEIWSDVMCPFCFIGKRLFDQALDAFAHKERIQVAWKSFHLFPAVRYQEGLDACTVLAKVKGLSKTSMQAAIAHVTELGKGVGIRFDFDRLKMVNTFDALRLVHLAALHDLGSEMKERLFQALFEEGQNLEDHQILTQLGKTIGLDTQVTATMLSSDAYAREVETDIAQIRKMGISGIPFFVLNQQHLLSGTQSKAGFSAILQTAFDEWRQETAPHAMTEISGESCSLGGQC